MGLKLLVVYFWLRNFIPIFIAGWIVAFLVWSPYKNSIAEIGAICFILAGFIAGIIIAEKDRKENHDAFQPDPPNDSDDKAS